LQFPCIVTGATGVAVDVRSIEAMTRIMSMLKGKKSLIVGAANGRSLA